MTNTTLVDRPIAEPSADRAQTSARRRADPQFWPVFRGARSDHLGQRHRGGLARWSPPVDQLWSYSSMARLLYLGTPAVSWARWSVPFG
jgi:hypothetical protein